jgi:hypothetical protein
MPGADHPFTFSGTAAGDKMSGTTGMGGAWSATREAKKAALLGTVMEFKVASLEIGVKPDGGETVFSKIAPDTQIVRIPVGERDLAKAQPAQLREISLGDRVLVSFVEGMTEARRIVLVAASEISKRNDSERMDWQRRGNSGVVTAKNGDEFALQIQTPQGLKTKTVSVNAKTNVRRYAPDSVRFADAQPSSYAEIAVGDQVRERGDAIAEDIVFGTFLTNLGSVTALDRAKQEIRIEEVGTHKPMTIRLTADSKLKMMPTFKPTETPMHARPMVMSQVIESLPGATIDDVKVGGAVVITSTKGVKADEATAIMLLVNADSLVRLAQLHTAGESPMDAIVRMHGGAIGGAGGLALPALLQ